MKKSDVMLVQESADAEGKNFFEEAEENPCTSCSALCCRLLIIPHPTPATFMDLDYIRYIVGFESTQMILNSDGRWQVLIERTCRLLDPQTNLCTMNDTPRKPKTCVFFNPHRCWYKWTFHNVGSRPELITIDMDGLEAILHHVGFDEEGNIIEIPPWQFIQELVNTAKSPQKDKPSDGLEKARQAISGCER